MRLRSYTAELHRPQTPRVALAKRLTQKFTPQIIRRRQYSNTLQLPASEGIYSPPCASSTFFAPTPHAAPHVLTRETTSPPTPRVLVKGRQPSRSNNTTKRRGTIAVSSLTFTEPSTENNPVDPHQPSFDDIATDLPRAVPEPFHIRSKGFARSWTQQMVKDPLVERFERLRLPSREQEQAEFFAPTALNSSRNPTILSLPRPSHESTTVAKQAWNKTAVSHSMLPTFREQPQSHPSHRDTNAYRSRQTRKSTGLVALDDDSDEEVTVVSERPASNFSNTNFFQSGGQEPSHGWRQSRIDRLLRKKPARLSRSPSVSSSDSEGELTPDSSEDSHSDLTARLAPAESRSFQEEQDHRIAGRTRGEEETIQSLFFERLRYTAPQTPARKTTPISSLKRAIARSGTQDDPISLDSDSDDLGEAHGEPMELGVRPTVSRPLQNQAALSRDCMVCGESVHVVNLPSLPNCGHRPETCADCYSGW
jgi:hypothetical protein